MRSHPIQGLNVYPSAHVPSLRRYPVHSIFVLPMAQTRAGALIIAAKKAGISVSEYEAQDDMLPWPDGIGRVCLVLVSARCSGAIWRNLNSLHQSGGDGPPRFPRAAGWRAAARVQRPVAHGYFFFVLSAQVASSSLPSASVIALRLTSASTVSVNVFVTTACSLAVLALRNSPVIVSK